MDDGIWRAFEDDEGLVAKGQNFFSKWLQAHAKIQDHKARQRSECLYKRLIICGLIHQMHIAWAVGRKQYLQARPMRSECRAYTLTGDLVQFSDTQQVHQ